MQPYWVKFVRGTVTVAIRGKGLEAFLNQAVAGGIHLWDIQRVGTHTVIAGMYIRDFFRLRPLLKQTGCRVRVQERRGFPFFLTRVEKRKFFIVGLLGFMVGLFLLTSMVWQIRVEGNEKIPDAEILKAASSQGIYKHQWKFRLNDMDSLSRSIHAQLPGITWLGVELQGTRIVIKVVESTRPDPAELKSPRHLVASKNAVITQIAAVKGKPAVTPNTYVRKGDVLISGIIGDETNQQVVVAEGKVKGIVWYESSVEVPLVRKHKGYTGESFRKQHLVIGNRALQLTGYGQKGYEQSESSEDRKVLEWRGYTLPIGWMTEKVMETETLEHTLEPAQAKELGLERARLDLMAQAGDEARFLSHSLLQEKTEDGKVYMKILFQIEEAIELEQPIVQEQPAEPAQP